VAILAILAIWSLSALVWFATSLVWVFNVWGAADLLVAFYQGLLGVRIDPGSLGAAYFIPTVLVPPLLVTHGLMFSLLLRKQRSASPSRAAHEQADIVDGAVDPLNQLDSAAAEGESLEGDDHGQVKNHCDRCNREDRQRRRCRAAESRLSRAYHGAPRRGTVEVL
jgi:hypothetical protein